MDTMRQRKHHTDIGRTRENPTTRQYMHSGQQSGYSYVKCGLWCVLVGPVVLLLILTYLLPCPIKPVAFSLPEPPKPEGILAPNTELQAAERLFHNQLVGPESIVIQNGHLYTGTADGKILHIFEDQMYTLATLGKPPCGDVHRLLSSSLEIGGFTPKFLNDLDIGSDGIIYLTDTSVQWQRRYFPYLILEGAGDGRLIRYDPVANKTEVLATGLHFGNGVQLSKKEDFLLVTETTRARILKYHLKGAKKGELEVFVDNLPGTPDNIRPSSRGGFWVAMGVTRFSGSFSLLDFLSTKPWFRQIISQIIPSKLLLSSMFSPSIIVELDVNGNIVRSLQDPERRTLYSVSEVWDEHGVLYMGSFIAPQLGRLDTRQ